MSVDRTRDGVTLHAEARPDAEPAMLRCDSPKSEKARGCTLLVLAHRAEAKGWSSILVDGAVRDLCRACNLAAEAV